MDYLIAGICFMLLGERIIAEILHHRERQDWMRWSKAETTEDLTLTLPTHEIEEETDKSSLVSLEDIPDVR